jgi:arginase family protein
VHEHLRIADYGDVPTSPFEIEKTYESITREFTAIYAAGCRTIAVGGDHGITYPILRAVAKHTGPVAIVQIDSHTDTHDTQFGYRFTHATPFRRAHEDGLLVPAKVMQLGIRGSLFYPDDLAWSRDHYGLVGLLDLERRGGHVAVVGDPDVFVHRHVVDGVVQADLTGARADRARSQSSADAVAGARVEGHPDERHVELSWIGYVGQTHEGRDAAVPGMHHAVDRLWEAHSPRPLWCGMCRSTRAAAAGRLLRAYWCWC